jgi:hypothetical protein
VEDETMSDEEKPRSWWQTLPGVITSLTAAITALAGLVVAVKQTGWFDSKSSPAAVAPPSASPTAAPPVAAAPAPTAVAPSAAYAVALPALRDYKLGPALSKATFTLLKAEVSPRTAEKSALQIRIRMLNHDKYDHNFWDQSFRLLVDGVPMAPEGGLNELVAAEAAKEGDVLFVIPRGTASGTLKITYYDDSTEIPLVLAKAP